MRLFFRGVLVSGMSGLCSVSYAQPKLEVQGHRGARAARPENTLPAFAYALKVGVDTLELDISVTKDDVIVVSHDPYVTPALCLTADGKPVTQPIPIRSLTLQELKSFDCGSLKNQNFPDQEPVPGTKIPTLDEVFNLVKNSPESAAQHVGFNIETKIAPRLGHLAPEPKKFVRLLLVILEKHGVLKRSVLQSFDHRTLLAAKLLEPKLKLAALLNNTWTDMPNLLTHLQADIISPHMDWVTAADVRAVHRLGKKVIPWTANTPADWDYLVQAGVDGIITDDPQGLIAYLKEKKLR